MSSAGPPGPEAVAQPERADDLVGSSAAGPAALRGSALRSGSYVVTVLLSLISAPLLIRHLGIVDFGRYSTVIALVTIVGGLTDGGLLSIALREWATHHGDERRWLMRGIIGLRIELSIAAVILGVAFAAIAGYDNVLVLGTALAGVGMMLQVIANLLTVALQGDLRFGWASVIDVVRQSVTVAAIVLLVLVGAGLAPFLAVTIPAGLTALVLTAALVRGRLALRPRLHGRERWPLLRDTIPYAAAIALNTLYFRVTIVAMSLIAVARQTGYFATSFRVTEVLVGVPALAVGTAFPILSRAAREDRERFQYATDRILELSLIGGVGLSLMVVLIAPFAIDVLAGASGAPAARVLQIQGIALIATFIASASGFCLLSLRRNVALLIANSAALVANIVLTLILVPIDRAQGAAVAAVAAESCVAIGQVLLLRRAGNYRIRLRSLLAVATAGLAGALPLAVPGLHPILRTAAGALIFVAVVALLGLTPPELRHVLEDRRQH